VNRAAPILVILLSACASASPGVVGQAPGRSAGDEDRARTFAFVRVEDDSIDWLVAADPRLAMRLDETAPDEVLKRVGLEAVLAEDTGAEIHGGSVDLFAFQARMRALDDAAKIVAAFRDPLPAVGPLGATLSRPRLERELFERLIQEERARTVEEAALGDAAGDLVRGIISTWKPPQAPQESLDRDRWVSKHLLDIRASMRDGRPRTGPSDLDMALYPLERLLAPAQFPLGSAAIAEVRMALDEDMRAMPSFDVPERLARAVKTHFGLTIAPAELQPRLERLEQRLREAVEEALTAESAAGRREIEGRARDLLLVERPCPTVPDTRVRSMAPPPERTAVCGALRALTEDPSPAAAIVAVHDDVLLSFAAVTANLPPRSRLLSHPDDDDIEGLRRKARERPLLALGVALAAEIIYGADGPGERLRAWRALGEAPLDVVAREVGAVRER
jgi:hypothetical protein